MNERPGLPAHSRVLFAAIVSALSCGCAVDQHKEVSIYRAVYDPFSTTEMHIEPGQIVTLTDALRIANRNEERLASQGESYLQALIEKDRAFAAFLPTVSVSPSYSVQDPSGRPSGSKNDSTVVPATAQLNIFNGFRDVASLKRSDATIEQQKQLLLDLQQSVLLEVAQTYFQILRSEQSVEVLGNSLQVQEARVNDIKSRAAVGTARPLDVAQQEAQASQTRVSLNNAEADVRNGRSLLSFLLDQQVQGNPLIDDYDPPADLDPVDAYTARAEFGRQDLRAAVEAMKAARQNVEIAFGQYYPTINVDLNYYMYRDPSSSSVWNSAISASLPIFTGGIIHDDVRAAWSQFRQSALTQAQLRRSIDNDVATAYVNLDLARRQLRELETQVEAAREALFLADQLYLNGKGTLLDRLISQDQLLSSQLQLTTQQFARKTAYMNLLRVVGQLNLSVAGATTQRTSQALHNLATQPATLPATQPDLR